MTPEPDVLRLVFILLVGIAWVLLFGRYAHGVSRRCGAICSCICRGR